MNADTPTRRYCTSCPCREACRDAFGRFWGDRSHGGRWCEHPFDGVKDARQPTFPTRAPMTEDELERAAWEEVARRCKRVERLYAATAGYTHEEIHRAAEMKLATRRADDGRMSA